MQHIHSKDIFYLLRDTLKLLDRRPIVHGGKVAYYVYKMLCQKDSLEKYELADIVFLVTFHDIGAYRTDDIEQMVRYETKQVLPHSQYGQLFLKKLTLLGNNADVILHHHTDFSALASSGCNESELASYIYLAEMIDIFSGSLGGKFSLDIFKNQLGSRFSPEAFKQFCELNDELGLFERVSSGEYKQEIEDLMDYFILTNEEKEKYMEFLMFTLALKSDVVIKNAAVCVALCERLGMLMRLDSANQKNLKYAAYLHDIGLMGFQKGWIENPAKLKREQMEKLAGHTLMVEKLLKDRMLRDVIVIASAHHERADGNGYPRRLTENKMSLAQQIMQFADAISETMVPPADKEKVIVKIEKQAKDGELSAAVTKVFLDKFDEIAAHVETRTAEILYNLNQIDEKFK
jgi:HD-GYP domain-containing protein (c-di-GMP phosphodiesterase class II)